MNLLIYKYLIIITTGLDLIAYSIKSNIYYIWDGLSWISNTFPQTILYHVLDIWFLISLKELRLEAFGFYYIFKLFQII